MMECNYLYLKYLLTPSGDVTLARREQSVIFPIDNVWKRLARIAQ